MKTVRTLVVAALLVSFPAIGTADVISFEVSDGELAVDFGLLPFELSAPAANDALILSGTVTLISGALVNHVIIDPTSEQPGFTIYSYGPGTVQLDLEGQDQNGNPVSGGFTGATQGFSITVCEECDTLFGGGLADDFSISLGAGQFDQPLAKLLGILPDTLGGSIDFGLESISGGPSSASRSGFDHRGFTNLEIGVQIPEPASILLLLTGAGACVSRARFRRRPRA